MTVPDDAVRGVAFPTTVFVLLVNAAAEVVAVAPTVVVGGGGGGGDEAVVTSPLEELLLVWGTPAEPSDLLLAREGAGEACTIVVACWSISKLFHATGTITNR